ncbi:MAG: fibronectin type III domain-containing protein [Candidatus Bipolaricaulaceae bacterium]
MGKRVFWGLVFVFSLALLGGCFLLAPPPPPENLQASDGAYVDQVFLSWSASPRATRYEIFRAAAEDGEYEKIGESSVPSFSDTTAQGNALYWYRVRACNQFGCSAFSSADSGYRVIPAPPLPPQNVQASDGTFSDRIRVTWRAAVAASSYEVFRSDIPGADYFKIAETTGTSYDDTLILAGRTYWYRVRACNEYGCSDFSPPDSGIAALQAPLAPQNVQASDGTFSDRVRITWSAVPGAARYEVHRATARDGTYELLAETTATSYDDTTVTVGTTYWYKVRAWNALGYGPFSEPDSGYAAAGGGGGGGVGQLPAQPQNVQASDGAYPDKIRITWKAVSGAKTYRIYFSETGLAGSFTQIAEVPSGTTSYDDTRATLTMCTEYWYAVSAWNDVGEGPLSVADSGYLGGTLEQVKTDKIKVTVTPSGTDANKATVKLEWEAVKDAAKFGVDYEIWRRVPAEISRKIGVAPSTTYEDTVEIGRTYYYKIRAVSSYSCITPGPFSGEVEVVVACNPAPPAHVTATESGAQITVSWDPVTGAQKYQIYRSTSADGVYTYVGEATSTTYTDSPPLPPSGTVTYYYKVKTCVACGCGGLSGASNGVTLP